MEEGGRCGASREVNSFHSVWANVVARNNEVSASIFNKLIEATQKSYAETQRPDPRPRKLRVSQQLSLPNRRSHQKKP